jgi:hypothetical protein
VTTPPETGLSRVPSSAAHYRNESDASDAQKPIGRIVGPDAMKFGGWQRLNAEYAKRFGIQRPDK